MHVSKHLGCFLVSVLCHSIGMGRWTGRVKKRVPSSSHPFLGWEGVHVNEREMSMSQFLVTMNVVRPSSSTLQDVSAMLEPGWRRSASPG